MVDIIIGEGVVNRLKEQGTIVSYDGIHIEVAYPDRTVKLVGSALEDGFIAYQNQELQNKVEEVIQQIKQQAEQKALEQQQERERMREQRKQLQAQSKNAPVDLSVVSTTVRLNPRPITLGKVRKKDVPVVQRVFEACDADTRELFQSFQPEMEYPRYTSHSRSKYYGGFLCKYENTYILRVFSRNDVYKQTKRDGVTVKTSDTTEVIRILLVNGRTYYFIKSLSYSLGYVNNANWEGDWHLSDMASEIFLNRVLRMCDCAYLNDYVEEKDINCFQYARLTLSGLSDPKAEIVLKNKLYTPTYRIPELVSYLQEFTSKQIDFAAKHNLVNALPVIKQHGIYDVDVLENMEVLLKRRRFGRSTYDVLKRLLEERQFDTSDLMARLVAFVKKVEVFDGNVYDDYLEALRRQPGVTLQDFFDKEYIQRHDVMLLEKETQVSLKDREKYEAVAKELSWIDRKENGYFIVLPKSISEFRIEGSAQHNCVFTCRYFKSVIRRESIVVFLRQEKDIPYVTIEYDYETFDVLQAYGKFNQRISPELYRFVKDLGKQLYKEMHTQA